MLVTIYHNPRCSKSRQTLALLQERKLEPNVVEYLKEPLTAAQINQLLRRLGTTADGLVREKELAELGLSKSAPQEALVAAMAEHPQVMQRPIVVVGEQACLGRPPENVLDLLAAAGL